MPQKFLILACYIASSRSKRLSGERERLQKDSGKRSLAKIRNAELRQSEYQNDEDAIAAASRRSNAFDGSNAFTLESLVTSYNILVDCHFERTFGADEELKALLGDSNFYGMVSALVHQLGILTAVPTTQPRSYDSNRIDLDCRSKSITNASNTVMYKCNLRRELVYEIGQSVNIDRTYIDID